jgi:hypothetical protein
MLTSLTGFIIFDVGLNIEVGGNNYLTIGMTMIGSASFAIYGLSFEFMVLLTPRKGESLTTGCINLWSCVFALIIYYMLYFNSEYTAKIVLCS